MKLRAQLWLPRPPKDVFPFFACAENLQRITPPWLDFTIAKADPSPIQRGTVIDYKLRLHGLPLHWRSEIAAWEPPFYFRDEQRRGPYRHWAHSHWLLPHEGGTLCVDEVDYAVPGGPLVERVFVRRDLRKIFTYRQRAVLREFCGSESDVVGSTGGPAWRVTFERGHAAPASISTALPAAAL